MSNVLTPILPERNQICRLICIQVLLFAFIFALNEYHCCRFLFPHTRETLRQPLSLFTQHPSSFFGVLSPWLRDREGGWSVSFCQVSVCLSPLGISHECIWVVLSSVTGFSH